MKIIHLLKANLVNSFLVQGVILFLLLTMQVTLSSTRWDLHGTPAGSNFIELPKTGQYLPGNTSEASDNYNPLSISGTSGNESIATSYTPPGLISNVTLLSGRNYMLDDIVVGVRIYTDRTYQVTSVPAILNTATLLKTANDDKTNNSADLLSFDLNQNATLYIAYDPRATVLPAWLNGWQKLPDQVGVTDSKNPHMNLYSKTYSPGRITLGGNLANPANGAMTNYFVMAKPISLVQYSLTTNSNGNGTVSKSPDQPTYNGGTNVAISAIPAIGQQFTGWSGDTSGIANPLNVTMNANKIVTANFTPTSALVNNVIANSGKNYSLAQLVVGVRPYTDRTYTITSVPGFLSNATLIQTANDDKTNITDPLVSFNLNSAATVYIAYDPRGTILPAWLNGWQKLPDQVGVTDSKNPHMDLYSKDFSAARISLGGNLASPASGALTNYFIIVKSSVQYSLNVNINGNGIVSKNPDQPTYNSGANVSLTAMPDIGLQFTGWTGDTSSNANPLNITMTANKIITANFTPTSALISNVIANSGKSYTLAQLAPGVSMCTDRNYTITSVPNFLSNATLIQVANDDKTNTANPFLSFNLNDTATLYIAYDPRATTLPSWLSSWQKLPTQIGVSDTKISNMNLYSKDYYPGRINLGGNLASPANGAMTNYFVIGKETVISPVQYSLQVNSTGNGTVTKNPDQPTYTSGTSVTLTAVPESGYQFSQWNGDANGASNPLNVIMDTGKTISASFATSTTSKSILFSKTSDSIVIQQGGTKSLPEYISTSDSIPVNAVLSALDENNNLPQWLTVNGQTLNGTNYTTGSGISFDFDATTLSVGTYNLFVNASAAGYNSVTLQITVIVEAGSSGTLTNLKINFQDSLTVPPSGWIRDYGQAFGQRISAYQGGGNVYGWIKKSDSIPVDLTKNSRKRNTPSNLTLSTLMHMQAGDAPSPSLNPIEGIWEAQVVDGIYDVTVSVGDGSYTNSKHTLNVEGVNAISAFIPTTSNRFDSATVTVSVSDGLLTIDATGGQNTKINYVIIKPTTGSRPFVVSVKPDNGSQQVSENTSISTTILDLPNSGIDNSTITSGNVYLTETATGLLVPSNVNGTGGGDAITLVPASKLKSNTTYTFNITSGVKDLSGAAFIAYTSMFTTGQDSTGGLDNVKFDKVALPNTVGRHSSLTMGPDGKLYALSIDGMIKRFPVNSDGTLGIPDTLYSLQDAYGARQQRLAIGFAFDPSSTASNLVAWVTHSSFVFLNGPSWDGKLTRLSGNNLESVQDILINLPRSVKDHLTNSIAFGPDGKLYFTQGSTSAMGRADNTWGNRNECLMSAAVLRLDVSMLGVLPLDVKTPDGGGSYNPFASGAPLTIYASGVRNAYDLVWHSNGNLYVPTNGSAAGGNTPASVVGAVRPDGSTYNGPVVPPLTNVQQTQKDFLFRVVQGGYYGHPNPLRGEYVMNGGNPTTFIDSAQVNDYPVGTLPDINWRRFAFDFQSNKSPNGAIEYKSNTFDGALKGKLLVVRYSQNDDIITLTPGGLNYDIISSTVGASIEGFSGFVDPLDLTEDTLTGNIYVSEYGGNGKIVLLRPRILLPTTANKSDSSQNSIQDYKNLRYSGLISLNKAFDSKNKSGRPQVYPNPFSKTINIKFPASYRGKYVLKMADILGRVFELGSTILKSGESSMSIDVSGLSLKQGAYFLRIISEDGKTTVIKLIGE